MIFRAFLAATILSGAAMVSAQIVPMPTTLNALAAPGSAVIVGNLEFYNFQSSGDVPLQSIQVIKAPGSELGLEFRADWKSSDGNPVRSNINYDVRVWDGSPVNFSVVDLSFNGATTGSGSGVGAGDQLNIFSLGGVSQLGYGVVQNVVGSGRANYSSTSLRLSSSVPHISVFNNITLDSLVSLESPAGPPPATATISFIDNTFQLTGTAAVPLPPALFMALCTIGLGLFAPIRRRVLSRLL